MKIFNAITSALCALTCLGACTHVSESPPRPASPCWSTLGTGGGPLPMISRAQPANLLSVGGVHYFVDLGDGGFSALARAGVSPRAVGGVFLSHLHFDHTGGLGALLGLRHALRIDSPLVIYGPPGTRASVDGLVASMQPAVEAGYGVPGEPVQPGDANLSIVELRGGEDPIDIGALRVTSVANSHYSFTPGTPAAERFASLSYRFDIGEWSVAYTGDTGPSAAVERLANDADLLVSEMMDYEATLANITRVTPGLDPSIAARTARHLASHHLTDTQVGELASRAHVGLVVITHLIPGNQDEQQMRTYVEAVAAQFDGPISIASDGDRFCALTN